MGMLEKIKSIFLVLALLALWIPFGVTHNVAMIITSAIVGVIAIIEFFMG